MSSAEFWDMYVDPLLPLVTDSCPIMQIIRTIVMFCITPLSVCRLCTSAKLKRPMHSLSVMRELFLLDPVQASAKRLWPGLVDFVPAIAYHFCQSLLCSIHPTWPKRLKNKVSERHSNFWTTGVPSSPVAHSGVPLMQSGQTLSSNVGQVSNMKHSSVAGSKE